MSTEIKSVKIQFEKLLHETGKAILVRFNNVEAWIPKKMCRNITINKKLGGNCIIPTWLYVEKFGEQPSEEQAAVIIEHHVPERITPKPIQPDDSLIR